MITLIVPCYNEAERLQIDVFLKASSSELNFIFVDDGSTDQTAEVIAARIKQNQFCNLLVLKKNVGKAEAIRKAVLDLQNRKSLWPKIKWVGYWDADLSTPITELPLFLKYLVFYPNTDAVWGCRLYRLGSHIRRSSMRHYLGRVFATIVHLVLGVEAYDTQCGAKIFRKEVIATAFQEPFISRWIFDIEILLRLVDYNVVEYPLQHWEDIPGSKIKIHREILRVLWDILKIRFKYHSQIRKPK